MTSGVYARTRNPIYLAALALSAGAAVLADGLWILLAALAWLAHTHCTVVPKEEEVRWAFVYKALRTRHGSAHSLPGAAGPAALVWRAVRQVPACGAPLAADPWALSPE